MRPPGRYNRQVTSPSDARQSLTLSACNAFILLYALDAGLTALDEIAAAVSGVHLLYFARSPAGFAALVAAAALYGWMAISARPPKRIFIPPILVLLWIDFGALPLSITAPASVGVVTAVVQAAATLYMLALVRRTTDGSWLLSPESVAGPSFRFASTAGFVTANLVLAPVVLTALFFSALALYVEKSTSGFVSFDTTGVNLDERRYLRDDHVIRLVGMMHIGELGGYRDLIDSFSGASTVVLAEGVSDEHGLLHTFGYGRAAKSLGLNAQPPIQTVLDEIHADRDECEDDEVAEEWPTVERADLDVGDFTPATVDFLNRVGRFWNAPDPEERLRELVALVSDPHAEEWARCFQVDLVDKRNRHLLERIEASLVDHRTIVVPWGGLHLPGIEHRILEWGFVPVESHQRRLLRYQTILAALALRWDQP